VLLGLPLAWLVGRGLDHLLVGVAPGDPAAAVLAGTLLLAGTALALAPAAREAATTDPAETLRD
jgi:hypothetical protein